MLKYFGLKEILFGFKRFAILIMVVAILFGVAGYLTGGKKDGTMGESEIYYSSCSYLFTAELQKSDQSQSESDAAVANTISTMITADFSKQYVFNKLIEQYSAEEIIKYTGSSMSKESVDYTVLNTCIVSRVLTDTPVVNFYVKSPNEEFSKVAVSCFEAYLNEVAIKQVLRLDSYQHLGGTTATEIGFNNESAPSPKKNAVIFAIIGFVLSACVVLVYVFFKPSVASKKTFEEYGITVLDDCAEHSAGNYDYATDLIAKYIDKGNFKAITIVSSINSKFFNEKQQIIIEKLNTLSDENYLFAKASNICSDFNQFETVKKSDGVILVERRGKTAHIDLENMISLLNKYDITIIGVVLI